MPNHALKRCMMELLAALHVVVHARLRNVLSSLPATGISSSVKPLNRPSQAETNPTAAEFNIFWNWALVHLTII